jgi:lactoylglutathione lyase
MQPIDPEKSPKVHVPALNHIGLWVDNLEAAVEDLSGKGYDPPPLFNISL